MKHAGSLPQDSELCPCLSFQGPQGLLILQKTQPLPGLGGPFPGLKQQCSLVRRQQLHLHSWKLFSMSSCRTTRPPSHPTGATLLTVHIQTPPTDLPRLFAFPGPGSTQGKVIAFRCHVYSAQGWGTSGPAKALGVSLTQESRLVFKLIFLCLQMML